MLSYPYAWVIGNTGIVSSGLCLRKINVPKHNLKEEVYSERSAAKKPKLRRRPFDSALVTSGFTQGSSPSLREVEECAWKESDLLPLHYQ